MPRQSSPSTAPRLAIPARLPVARVDAVQARFASGAAPLTPSVDGTGSLFLKGALQASFTCSYTTPSENRDNLLLAGVSAFFH